MAVPFNIPYLAGNSFVVGRQPFNPGQPGAYWPGIAGGVHFPVFLPWPKPVQTINSLSNNFGVPRLRANPGASVTPAAGLENYLFISGFVGKSKG